MIKIQINIIHLTKYIEINELFLQPNYFEVRLIDKQIK